MPSDWLAPPICVVPVLDIARTASLSREVKTALWTIMQTADSALSKTQSGQPPSHRESPPVGIISREAEPSRVILVPRQLTATLFP